MKCEFTVNKEKYFSWIKSIHTSGIYLAIRIFGIVCFLLSLAMTVFSTLFEFRNYAIIFALLSLLFLYEAIFKVIIVANRNYSTLAKVYGDKQWKTEIVFEDGKIIVIQQNGKTEYSFDDVCKIIDNTDLVKLTFKSKLNLFLYKSGFTEGSWDECKALINKNDNP
jgi:hypothetical protein